MELSTVPPQYIAGLSVLVAKVLEHPRALAIVIVIATTVVIWKFLDTRSK